MPLMFRTPKDSTDAVELVGVGLLPAGGRGGLAVTEAARRGFAPLVAHDEVTGYPATNEDGSYVVLEGPALAAAAKQWAAAHGAVEVHNARNEEEIAAAQAEVVGRLPDAYPVPASAKAEDEAVRIAGTGAGVVLNEDRDANALGLPDPAASPDAAGGAS